MSAGQDAVLAELVTLLDERDQLRAEIEDLKDFEREYRRRLAAWVADAANALKEDPA